jgi:hypothetical protein
MLAQQPIDGLLIASPHGPRQLALLPNVAPIEQWESKLVSVIRHPSVRPIASRQLSGCAGLIAVLPLCLPTTNPAGHSRL